MLHALRVLVCAARTEVIIVLHELRLLTSVNCIMVNEAAVH